MRATCDTILRETHEAASWNMTLLVVKYVLSLFHFLHIFTFIIKNVLFFRISLYVQYSVFLDIVFGGFVHDRSVCAENRSVRVLRNECNEDEDCYLLCGRVIFQKYRK